MKPGTILYSIRKALSTKLGMGIFSATMFYGLMLLVGGIPDKSGILVLAIVSVLFGVFFSMSTHKRVEPMLINGMDKNQYDTHRRYSHMLNREEIPKSQLERKHYLKFLEKQEKVMQTALGRNNTIWLSIIMLMAVQTILFSEGMSWMKILAIFVVLALSFSYYSARKQYQKIQRLKGRLMKV